MILLSEVATNSNYSTYLQWSFFGILGIGFAIAVIVGSIAWYNSKPPVGWENTEKPNWVPTMDSEEKKSDSSQK
ncbi:MAG: hypothetical protein QNJ54_30955 [Prochloraceae cyanobacterium]|nr:hypothetical protein [Prochloraceae cyanobacterium]